VDHTSYRLIDNHCFCLRERVYAYFDVSDDTGCAYSAVLLSFET